VVLGSGWGGLTEHITHAVQIRHTALEGFAPPTVASAVGMTDAPVTQPGGAPAAGVPL